MLRQYFLILLLPAVIAGGIAYVLLISYSGKDSATHAPTRTENIAGESKNPEAPPTDPAVEDLKKERAVQIYPEPLSPDSYGELKTLVSEESRYTEGLLTVKSRIVSADFKYPLIRIEEVFADNPQEGGDPVRIKHSVMVADHLLLRYEDGQKERIIAELSGLGYETMAAQSPKESFVRVSVPADNPDALTEAKADIEAKLSGISVEPDYLISLHRSPNDPLYSKQWSLANIGQSGGTAGADIDAPEAWEQATGSGDVIVAVIDTGLDLGHPDFAGNIRTNPLELSNGQDTDGNGFVDDLGGWNFYGRTNDVTDDNYHGTHVAGTIGARGNNGIGVSGVTWDVKILPVKVFNQLGAGTLSDAVEGIYYAVDSGARVINASWGFRENSALLSDAINYAGSRDCLIVASAGNDGLNNDLYPVYPASFIFDNVISVAATDHDDQLAGFSNYGNSVDIAAPGIGILSTTPELSTLHMVSYGILPSYGHASGTSMSAPHVSGAIALLLSEDPNLAVIGAKQRLLDGAKYMVSLVGLLKESSRLDLGTLFDTEVATSPSSLVFHSTSWQGKSGSVLADGIVHPGDEVDLGVSFVNEGTLDAQSAILSLEIVSGHAVLIGESEVALGKVAGKEFRSVPNLPYVSVLPNSPDNLSVIIRMTLRWARGTPVSGIIEIPVVALQDVQAVAKLSFQVSEVLAAPTTNVVYMLSPSDWRVLAFDTELAQFTHYQQLGVKPSASTQRILSGMAVNHAGDRLFIAVPKLKQIHVLSLPSLAPLAVLDTDFEPSSLALDSSGRLFASTHNLNNPLKELSVVNGSVIRTHSEYLSYEAKLKTNEAGTRLYGAFPKALGPGSIQEWDVSSTEVSYLGSLGVLYGYLTDFAVDDENDRIFSTHQAINALQVTHFNPQKALDFLPFRTNDGLVLDVATGGAAVSYAPGKNYVLAASSSRDRSYIHRYKRDTGEALGSYRVMGGNYSNEEVLANSLCVTENDRAVYIGTLPTRYIDGAEYEYDHYINLIGADSVSTTVPPPASFPAIVDLISVSFQDFGGNADRIPNPGEAISLRFLFKNLGETPSADYSLALASDNAGGVVVGSPVSVLSISGGDTFLSSAVAINLGSNLAVGTEIAFTLTLSAPGAQSYSFIHRITVRAASTSATPSIAAFTEKRLTGIVASPNLNEVYIGDAATGSVIAVDTTLGAIRKISAIPDEQRANMTIPINELGIAISPDGTRLALFSKYESDLHVFRLPDLTWLDSFELPQSNYALAFDSDNNLHAGGRPDPGVYACQIIRFDSETGAILSTYGSRPGGVTLLKASKDGTRLAMSYSENYANPLLGGIDVYDVSVGATPQSIAALTEHSPYFVFLDSSIWMSSGTSIREYNLTSGSYSRSTAGTDFFTSLNLTPNGRLVCSNRAKISEYQSLIPRETVVSAWPASPNHGQLRPNGVAVTPDGRISYITEYTSYFSGKVTSSGFWSCFGIVGQGVSLEEPSELPIKHLRTDILDAAPGNANGYAEPGETIKVSPYFRNTGFAGVSGLTVVLESENPNVSVVGQNSRNFPSVGALTNFNLDNEFSVLLSPNTTDGESLGLSLVISYGSVIDTVPLALYAFESAFAYAETDFELGETLAHPYENTVYLTDRTNSRLLALDTDTGTIPMYAILAGAPGVGEIAVSPDGGRVAVALADANLIQILDSKTLTAIDLIHLDFKPERISFASDHAIYANSSADRQIIRINPEDDEDLPVDSVTALKVYQRSAELRAPFTFTTGFASSVDEGGGGSLLQVPIHMLGPTTFYTSNIGKDLAFDPDGDRIYTACNALGGYVTTSLWRGETFIRRDLSVYAQASAIALHPSSPFLYVAEDKNFNPYVTRIDRKSGKFLAKFAGNRISTGAGHIKPRSLEVTSNGKMFFATGNHVSTVDSRKWGLHLTGSTNLDLSLPVGKVPLDAGSNLSVKVTNPANLEATLNYEGTAEISWSKLEGPGSVSFTANGNVTTASFSQPGKYQLESNSTAPGTVAKDRVVVRVQPDESRIYAEVIRPVATSLPLRPAILRVHRVGDITERLEFSVVTGGSATSGLHYLPIVGTQSFEMGNADLDIEIIPTEYGGLEDEEMTLSLLPV